jgi:hypothetical protein
VARCLSGLLLLTISRALRRTEVAVTLALAARRLAQTAAFVFFFEAPTAALYCKRVVGRSVEVPAAKAVSFLLGKPTQCFAFGITNPSCLLIGVCV